MTSRDSLKARLNFLLKQQDEIDISIHELEDRQEEIEEEIDRVKRAWYSTGMLCTCGLYDERCESHGEAL